MNEVFGEFKLTQLSLAFHPSTSWSFHYIWWSIPRFDDGTIGLCRYFFSANPNTQYSRIHRHSTTPTYNHFFAAFDMDKQKVISIPCFTFTLSEWDIVWIICALLWYVLCFYLRISVESYWHFYVYLHLYAIKQNYIAHCREYSDVRAVQKIHCTLPRVLGCPCHSNKTNSKKFTCITRQNA